MKLLPLVLAAMLTAFAACTPRQTPSESASSAVSIGVDLPLTGAKSYYGVSARQGIELAVEQLKTSHPGAHLALSYEDNQAEPRLAATALSKLININHASAVIGGGTSAESSAMAPMANQTKTVLISPISSASALVAAGPYFFRTCPADSAQARDLAAWIQETGIKKIGVIYVEGAWGSGFKDDFLGAFKGESQVKGSDAQATDFRPQILALLEAQPDALVFITYAKEGAAAVRQARELGFQKPIYGGDPWSQDDFRNTAGEYANGVRYTTPVQYDGDSFTAFRKAFVEKYKSEPDVYAANGYDCLNLLAGALEANAKTGEQIRTWLLSASQQGATGLNHFSDKGEALGKSFGRFEIKDGKVVPLPNKKP